MSVINPNPFTTRPEIEGTFGVVASTHWIATAVGMATLEKGGNAFDAAVATAFTLQVVEPHLNGPGGDVPVIVYDTRRGKPEVICGQGPVPAGATIAHYRREGLELAPGTGLLAACVPGTFETWMLLLRDYGSLSLREVLSPAIGYAQNGYPLVERANATIATVAELFRAHWPTSAAVYLPNNMVPPTGTLFTNQTLAATYLRILKEAKAPAAIVSCRSSGRAHPGRGGSWPRRSTASATRRRSWTRAACATAACSRPTTWRAGRRALKRR